MIRIIGAASVTCYYARINLLEGETMNEETMIDVRPIAPAQRHPLIFGTFEQLTAGETFVLVNDHDPKPLFYQFMFERSGQFTWDYLEQGPDVWRVRIGRC